MIGDERLEEAKFLDKNNKAWYNISVNRKSLKGFLFN